jgi:hypothetical protein
MLGMVENQQEMAGLLWACYKERMGRTGGIDMQFDLS